MWTSESFGRSWNVFYRVTAIVQWEATISTQPIVHSVSSKAVTWYKKCPTLSQEFWHLFLTYYIINWWKLQYCMSIRSEQKLSLLENDLIAKDDKLAMYKEQLHMCETNLYETQLRTKDEISKLRFITWCLYVILWVKNVVIRVYFFKVL